MINKETLEHWKKLCENASHGPWLNKSWDEDRYYSDEEIKDCAFIAESRTALPQLIEAYEKLKLELDAAVEGLRRIEKYVAHNGDTWVQESARAVLAKIDRGEK